MPVLAVHRVIGKHHHVALPCRHHLGKGRTGHALQVRLAQVAIDPGLVINAHHVEVGIGVGLEHQPGFLVHMDGALLQAESQRMAQVDIGAEDVAADPAQREHIALAAEIQPLDRRLVARLDRRGGQALLHRPARAAAPGDQRATGRHPVLQCLDRGLRHSGIVAPGQHDGGVARQVDTAELGRLELAAGQAQVLVKGKPGRADFRRTDALAHYQRDGRSTQRTHVVTAQVHAGGAAPGGQGLDTHAVFAAKAVDLRMQRSGVQRLAGHRHHHGAMAMLAGRGLERGKGCTQADARRVQATDHPVGTEITQVHGVGIACRTTNYPTLGCRHGGDRGTGRQRRTAGRVLQAIGRGHGIGGAVVEHIAFHRRGELEDRMGQAELRLARRHHPGTAGQITLAIDAQLAGQLAHFDAVGQQAIEQAPAQRRIIHITKHPVAHAVIGSLLQGTFEEVLLQGKQAILVLHRTAHTGQADGQLVADGEVKMQRPVDRLLHQATRGGLLHRHPDRAVEIRVGRTEDRREVVEGLPGVIQRADAIQGLGVEAGQPVVGLEAALGQQRRLHAFRGGFEVVGRILAHLVEVDLDVGVPLVEVADLRAGVFLGNGQPVTVEVGQVMVEAPARERFHMLAVGRIAGRRIAAPGVVPVGRTVTAIGILRRIDHHHGLVEPAPCFGILAGGQVVRGQQCRLATGSLVAMHAVGQPGHGRRIGRNRRSRVHQLLALGLDALPPGQVGGRGNGHQQQRAAFVALADVLELHPVRHLRQLLEVGH